MNFVEGKILPKELISLDNNADQLLYPIESLLVLDDLAHAEGFVVKVLAELVALHYQILFDPSQTQLLIEGQIAKLQL